MGILECSEEDRGALPLVFSDEERPGGYLSVAQLGEVLGNLHLRLLKNLLKMADTEFPVLQQVQDAQARLIAQALIDLNQAHG